MEGDVTFTPGGGETKTGSEHSVAETKTKVAGSKPVTQTTPTVDPPFTLYKTDNGKPYIADHFDLGEHWQDFPEVEEIDNFLTATIESGEVANSIEAIKIQVKKMEKLANIDPTERTVVRVAKLAAFMKFLKETKDIEQNNKKYGYSI